MKSKFSLVSKTPYVPKIWVALVYFLLFIGAFTLFGGRSLKKFRFSLFLNFDPDFYSHISNFSISLMLCLVVGYINIMTTNKLKTIGLFSIFVIVSNFTYEWFIPLLSTPDKIDALYGLTGTIMVIYKYYGLRENPNYNSIINPNK